MNNVNYCDRCKTFSEGDNTVVSKVEDKPITRENYETLDDTSYEVNDKPTYYIDADYGSDYDTCKIRLVCTECSDECSDKCSKWKNLCDNCIGLLLVRREAIPEHDEGIIYPCYTACCDKLCVDNVENTLYNIEKVNCFPYTHYYRVKYEGGSTYITGVDFPDFCVICEECLYDYDESDDYPFNRSDPVHYALRTLRTEVEFYIHRRVDFQYNPLLNGNNFYRSKEYIDLWYMYQSKRNMLLLKRELSYHVAKRNLELIKDKFWVPKDIFNLILSFV